MIRRITFLATLLTLALACMGVAPVLATENPLAERLRDLTHHVQEGIQNAEKNKPELMKAEYAELRAFWNQIEDQVRAADAGGYADIEAALASVEQAIDAQPLDAQVAKAAFEQLDLELTEVADRLAAQPPTTAASTVQAATLPDALALLAAARAATARGDPAEAKTQLNAFIVAWPSVEGAVASRSQDAYAAVETAMGRAAAALSTTPADVTGATAALDVMTNAIVPYVDTQSYTWLDAAAIILREGLEALLVVVALLAFLKRSGNADKQIWIWVGGALGVASSLVTAFLLQAVFSSVVAGHNRELIEGSIGLIAAGMLFYVSYWLHSKASIKSWKRYIDTQTTQALAKGSMAGLALLAFLAVFREGAETAVFYLGMAPAIAPSDLALGLGVGVVALTVIAALILLAGVRLPLRLFFRVAGLLVYYLGFKFVGTGIHALQVAGVVPTTPIPGMVAVPLLGMFPTWQTLLPQVLMLAGAGIIFLLTTRRERPSPAAQAAV